MDAPASAVRPRPPRRPRCAPVAGVLALVVLVGGATAACSIDAPRTEPALSRSTTACLTTEVLEDLGLGQVDTGAAEAATLTGDPAAAAVPAGFVPVGLVECAPGEQLTDVKGVWDAVTVRQLEGDLEPVLAALVGPVPTTATACSAPGAEPELWLVDALNRAVRVAGPVDACGSVAPAVHRAVSALAEISVSHYRVRLASARVTEAPTP